MKCKNCGEKVTDPEVNNGKINCSYCGWIIGHIDTDAVNNVPT